MNGSEDLLRQTLRSLAREVNVSEDEIAAARHRLARLRVQQQRRRLSVVALTAAAALVGAVAGGLAVRGLDGPEAVPAAPADAAPTGTSPVPGAAAAITPEDLAGLWVIPDNSGWVWEFHADGTMGWMNPGAGADYEETYFQVAGDILDTELCPFRVRMTGQGTMTGEIVEKDGTVGDCEAGPGDPWIFIRVQPQGMVSAWAFEGLALANTAEVTEEAMVGVWWREDTGQALMVTKEDGGLVYALDDDGDIAVAPDDVGSLVLDRAGELTLTSRAAPGSSGTCRPGESATLGDLSLGTYDSRLWATPVRVLSATSAPGACTEHADLGGVWLRVP